MTAAAVTGTYLPLPCFHLRIWLEEQGVINYNRLGFVNNKRLGLAALSFKVLLLASQEHGNVIWGLWIC